MRGCRSWHPEPGSNLVLRQSRGSIAGPLTRNIWKCLFQQIAGALEAGRGAGAPRPDVVCCCCCCCPPPPLPRRCLAFAASPDRSNKHVARVVSGAAAQQPAAQEKYDRILAFVDAHATPIVLSSASSSVSSACEQQLAQPQKQQQLEDVTSSWHFSYDEEAEEGEELHEPAVLAFAASVPAAVAESAAAAAAALTASPSWSYGNPMHPKPFFYAWDEEAEGAFELEPCCSSSSSAACLPAAAAVPADPVAAAAALRAQRRAALHEARHAARASRRMRRSQLHPQLGDLEHMPAWVQPAGEAQQQHQRRSGQRSAAGTKYAQLLALVAGDAATGQYRTPRSWHLTFDEDVHGPDAPETVLGSC